MVRFLAATGARVSELVQIKVEHVKIGYLDLYSKGGKLRRIYIPSALQKEALSWLKDCGKQSGFIFVNKQGERITARGIAGQLKYFGTKYGLSSSVIYIRIPSAIVLPKAFWTVTMISLCSPI